MIFMSEITDCIIFKLKEEGFETRDVDYRSILTREGAARQKPAANIHIPSGSWANLTMKGMKQSVNVSIIITTYDAAREKNRRKKMLDLVDSLAFILMKENLDLDIRQILPLSFSDVTTQPHEKAGILIYEVIFNIVFERQKIPPELEENGILEYINNKYYVNPNDDGLLDLESEVQTINIVGGNPFDKEFGVIIDGGLPGTKSYDYIYNGGTPESV